MSQSTSPSDSLLQCSTALCWTDAGTDPESVQRTRRSRAAVTLGWTDVRQRRRMSSKSRRRCWTGAESRSAYLIWDSSWPTPPLCGIHTRQRRNLGFCSCRRSWKTRSRPPPRLSPGRQMCQHEMSRENSGELKWNMEKVWRRMSSISQQQHLLPWKPLPWSHTPQVVNDERSLISALQPYGQKYLDSSFGVFLLWGLLSWQQLLLSCWAADKNLHFMITAS